MRDPNSTRDERHKALGIMVVVSVLLVIMAKHAEGGEVEAIPLDCLENPYAMSAPRYWNAAEVPVYHNAAGKPQGYTDEVMRAMWIWKERTGVNLVYRGMTDQTEIQGAIVVRWQSLFELFMAGHYGVDGYATTWYYTSTGIIDRVRITMKSDIVGEYDCAMTALVHEFGHALGIGAHSPHYDDVMSVSTGSCRPSPSAYDVSMTAYDGGDRCFVELGKDYDLYVPSYDGLQANLSHDAGTWSLDLLSSSDGACDSVMMDGADVIMTDVRGFDMSLTRVELQSAGNDEWVLRWAE